MFFFGKKIISAITLAVLLSGMIFPLMTQAQFFGGIVFDPKHTSVTTLQSIDDWGRWLKDEFLAALRDRIVKMMIDRMTADIISSIQNGGSPRFVTNWKSFLTDSGDAAFNIVNNQLISGGIDLCSPLLPQLFSMGLSNLRDDYYNYVSGSYFPIRCRFDDFRRIITSNDPYLIDNLVYFGGWDSYDAVFSPETNLSWLALDTKAKFIDELKKEDEAKKNEALSSSGYLGVKECTAYKEGFTSADANTIAEIQCSGVATDPSSGSQEYYQCLARALNDFNNQNCLRWSNNTPGDLVAKAATKSIDGQFDYVANIQSIVSTLVNVLINRLLNEGLTSITNIGSGDYGDSYTSEGSNIGDQEDINRTFYQNRLDEISRDYSEVYNYLTGVLGDINQSIEIINSRFGTCPSAIVEFDAGNGTVERRTVAELLDNLNTTRILFEEIRARATEALTRIDELDYSADDFIQEASLIADEYADFSQDYQVVISDVTSLRLGQGGEIASYYANMNDALNSFNCSGF